MISFVQVKNIIFLIGLSFFFSCNYPGSVQVVTKELNTIDDIIEIKNHHVIPVDYVNGVSLNGMTITERKKKFIDLILPAILIAKHQLLLEQYKVKGFLNKDTSRLCEKNKLYLDSLSKIFKADNLDLLISKIETHPTSIVLAQAAIESGWGTSRFFLEANNIFGVWSFSSADSRVKSISSRNGKDIYLRKYSTLHESVIDYFKTISRGPYDAFRTSRLTTKDPFELIPYLINYSEKREEYVYSIENLIRKNNFVKYDNYKIDARHIIRYW